MDIKFISEMASNAYIAALMDQNHLTHGLRLHVIICFLKGILSEKTKISSSQHVTSAMLQKTAISAKLKNSV